MDRMRAKASNLRRATVRYCGENNGLRIRRARPKASNPRLATVGYYSGRNGVRIRRATSRALAPALAPRFSPPVKAGDLSKLWVKTHNYDSRLTT